MSTTEAAVESLPAQAFERLGSSRKWIFVLGLITGAGAVGILVDAFRIAMMDAAGAVEPMTLALIAIGFGCLYLTVTVYLMRLEAAIGRALAQRGATQLEAAMRLQGRLFRFGALVILSLIFGVILIVVIGKMTP